MNKVYGVFHLYDEDGGFGDAIRQKDLICILRVMFLIYLMMNCKDIYLL